MASGTDPKSISSGLSLPIWMRRIENKFDDSTTFSPPAHDESFFCIRYPVSKNSDDKQLNLNNLNSALQNTTIAAITEQQQTIATNTITVGTPGTTINATGLLESKVDFSKHTEPCRKFIGEKIDPLVPNIKGQKKSQGTDDGFKHAACGNSILKVAQQVVSGRQFYNRGGLIITTIDEANVDQDEIINVHEETEMINSARGVMRRGSKSLPTSPIGSPKTGRKVINYNPYFTTYSTPGTSSVENRSWILSSLFGLQRETVNTKSSLSVTSQIDEDVEEATEQNNNTVNGNNNTNGIIKGIDSHKKHEQQQQITLKAKPNELREMNFWCPTSM